MENIVLIANTVLVAILYASIFEWLLHKFVMHRAIFGFKYAYRAHAQVHHGLFRADRSYHLQKAEDKETIPMAWWNGPVLVIISSTPFYLIGWLLQEPIIPVTTLLR